MLKVIHFDSAPPDVQEGLRASRAKEWNKFVQVAAAIPITGGGTHGAQQVGRHRESQTQKRLT